METAKLLIQRGANPSLASTNGSTALHFAAHRGNDQVAELLVNHAEIEVDSKDNAHMTPLHLACVSGNAAISRLLLDQGADITAKSSELMTPLHTAVYNGNSEVAAMILRAGGWPVKKVILADNSIIVPSRNVIYLVLTIELSVASWLVRHPLDRAIRVQALAGNNVFCFRVRHLTLTVPFSTKV